MPVPLFAAANLASGLIGGITGAIQLAKGNKLRRKLQYPTETLPSEYTQSQNLAQQMASTGMPSEQYNQAMRNIQRQQLTALRYAKDRRGGLNVLPQITQGTNDALVNLDVADALQRQQNQRSLINYNTLVGGVKRDLFQRNVRDKYNRDYNYAMSLVGAGNQNLVGGIEKLAAGGLASFGGGSGGGYGGYVPGGVDYSNVDYSGTIGGSGLSPSDYTRQVGYDLIRNSGAFGRVR